MYESLAGLADWRKAKREGHQINTHPDSSRVNYMHSIPLKPERALMTSEHLCSFFLWTFQRRFALKRAQEKRATQRSTSGKPLAYTLGKPDKAGSAGPPLGGPGTRRYLSASVSDG